MQVQRLEFQRSASTGLVSVTTHLVQHGHVELLPLQLVAPEQQVVVQVLFVQPLCNQVYTHERQGGPIQPGLQQLTTPGARVHSANEQVSLLRAVTVYRL